MEKLRCFLMFACLAGAFLATGCSPSSRTGGGESGAALFAANCATCHPNGSNVINPSKSLLRLTLAANGITTPEGIVHRMRNPGPGMKRFDPAELSDEDARKIAAYILATFR
jgi:cytochrome c6